MLKQIPGDPKNNFIEDSGRFACFTFFRIKEFSEEAIELLITGPSSHLEYNPLASNHLGDSEKKDGIQTGMRIKRIGMEQISWRWRHCGKLQDKRGTRAYPTEMVFPKITVTKLFLCSGTISRL